MISIVHSVVKPLPLSSSRTFLSLPHMQLISMKPSLSGSPFLNPWQLHICELAYIGYFLLMELCNIYLLWLDPFT